MGWWVRVRLESEFRVRVSICKHKVLHLHRNLHIELHKNTAPSRKSALGGSPGAVPALKSALRGKPRVVPTTKSAREAQRTVPDTKFAF